MTPYAPHTRNRLHHYLRLYTQGDRHDAPYLFVPDRRYRPGLRPRLALGRSRTLGRHRVVVAH